MIARNRDYPADRPALIAFPEDRLPPQNIEAELGALGGMLLDDQTIDDVMLTVAPGDFYRDSHQRLCEAIYAVHATGTPVDTNTVYDRLLVDVPGLDDDAALEVIKQAATSVPHAANARFYAGIVREKSDKRRLIEAANTMLRDGYGNQHTAEEVRDRAGTALDAIGDRDAGDEPMAVAVALDAAMERIRLRGEGEVSGVPTGYEPLDGMLGGCLGDGTLTILAARPSMGKSALALGICEHAALSGGAPVLFLSLEMGEAEIGERLISGRAGVDGMRLKKPWQLDGRDHAAIARARAEIAASRLKIDPEPVRSMAAISAVARRARRKDGIALLVIDYIQLIDGTGDGERGSSRQEVVSTISRRLKTLARKLNIPILALAQLNRLVEARDGHRPRMSDLRESGSLEQDADNVILVHRPDYYDPNDKPGIAEIIVAKSRNGPVGHVELAFVKPLARFREITPDFGAIPAGDF